MTPIEDGVNGMIVRVNKVMSETISRREGIIGWFVRNHGGLNLMMFAIIGWSLLRSSI